MQLENLLQSQVDHCPEKIAVVDKGVEYTYEAIYQNAVSLSNTLRENISDVNSPISLAFDPSVEGVVSTYACIISHFVFVPISPKESIDSICDILARTKSDVVVSNTHFPETSKIEAIRVSMQRDYEKKVHNLASAFSMNDEAAILFTSGSNGKSKGVVIPKIGWEGMVDTWEKEVGISKYNQFLVMSGF